MRPSMISKSMISKYVEKARERARYDKLEDGTYCATVPGLRGVVALGRGREQCRREFAEVVEEWVLVRVARGLPLPRLGGVVIKVRRAG
jgi:predicted RNase H-like HicB family nuclease